MQSVPITTKLVISNPTRASCTRYKLCDKVWQWLTAGRWFSLVFYHHDITEIMLNVALSPITPTLTLSSLGLNIFWTWMSEWLMSWGSDHKSNIMTSRHPTEVLGFLYLNMSWSSDEIAEELLKVTKVIKTEISNLMHMELFWNNLHQQVHIHKIVKSLWKTKTERLRLTGRLISSNNVTYV